MNIARPHLTMALLLLFSFCMYAQSGPTVNRERGQVNADPLWRQALGGAVTGLPTVQAQSAVVVLDGGNIKAYSTAGTPLWNYSARGRLSPFVTRSREGTSYISRTNGTFIAVNRAGRELWRLSLDAPLSGPVICGWDGRLFVPAGKKLLCYTASGNMLWSKQFENPIGIGPVPDQDGGLILALESSAEVLCVDPFGGETAWKLSAPPRLLVPTGVARNGSRRIMALHADGSVEISGGFEEWYVPAEAGKTPPAFSRLPAPPLSAASRGNNAAITLDDGRVILVSGDEGKILWTGESHIRVRGKSGGAPDNEAAMVYDERGIYVLSKNGATGFTEDGRRLWFTTLENAAAVPAFGDDGVLYSGGKDWILYAYRLEDRALRQKQSMYGPAPEGSYGTGSPPPSPWADYAFRFEESELKTRLEHIGAGIRSGRVGENELAWTAYLMEIAGGDSGPQASLTHPAVPIQYRVQALTLLSRVGSRETIPWLANIFRRENDGVVKAAAAEAIGVIGVDPDGIALQAFFDAVSSGTGLKDEQALLALAAAAGALCRFSGPPLSHTGVKILNLLTGPGQSPAVQRQARRELNRL
jgi:outer membrane protein assembly factor BamB